VYLVGFNYKKARPLKVVTRWWCIINSNQVWQQSHKICMCNMM